MLLPIRQQLDLYINLRPIRLLPGITGPLRDRGPEDIDFVCVRENTEGEYCGVGGRIRAGHARRGRHADGDLHAQGHRARRPLCLRPGR